MIKLFYTDTGFLKTAGDTGYLLSDFPAETREKISSVHDDRERILRLAGKLLLRKVLLNLGYPATVLSLLSYTEYKKPVIANTCWFNISHSGSLVVCAISSEGEIGVDIEQKQPLDFTEFRSQFSSREWETIVSSPDPLRDFYVLWTEKEAVLKAAGRGFYISSLTEVSISGNRGRFENKEYFLSTLDLFNSSYLLTVASDFYSEIHLEFCEIQNKSAEY